MSPIAIVLSYVWVKGGERRLVDEQEAPPVLNGPVMPRRFKLQHLASLGFPLADPAVGFGGGQLGDVTQARVPPKLKTPRIWPTIFGGVVQKHVQK